MAIKVRAIEQGHYGHFRDPGDEFEIADEADFSTRWMETVDEAVPPGITKKVEERKAKLAAIEAKRLLTEKKNVEVQPGILPDKKQKDRTPKGVPPFPGPKISAPLPEDVI